MRNATGVLAAAPVFKVYWHYLVLCAVMLNFKV